MATDKQERAVQIYVENRGKSVSSAMREAGYSDATARNPKNLTETKAWKELLDKAMPDKKLLSIHKKRLQAPETVIPTCLATSFQVRPWSRSSRICCVEAG
jgi:hypothetical protein